jgi:hypothetical protein
VTPPGALTVDRLRLRFDGETSRLRLTASSLPALASLSPATQTLFVQLAADDGEPSLCAAIDAVHFRGKKSAVCTDRTGGVPSARDITSVRLQRRGSGLVRLKLAGARVAFGTRPTGRLRIAVALRSLAEPGTPTRCTVRTVGVIGGPD